MVENPHPELFGDLDFGRLTESEVMGHKLNVIQSHAGCEHDCEGFCDANAPNKIISRMPFMGLYRIAQSKLRYDRRYARISENWYRHIHKMGIVPESESLLDKRIRSMKRFGEFYDFILQVLTVCEQHPISDHLRLWEITAEVDFRYIWENYGCFLPVLFNSLQNSILTYNNNDPVAYTDPRFRHEDGTPADFGDLFLRLDTYVRPVFVSTAGWLESNSLAERAMHKVVDRMKGDVCSAGIRLSIKRYEKLARTSPEAYLYNLKRMLSVLWPLRESNNLFLAFYYDVRVEDDELWAVSTMRELDEYAKLTLGDSIADCSECSLVSHYGGRAYDPRYAEEDGDPDNTWGYEIRPDGTVTWRDETRLVRRETPDGHVFYWSQSPMAEPEDTGVCLW
jgi:hypothetical protein